MNAGFEIVHLGKIDPESDITTNIVTQVKN